MGARHPGKPQGRVENARGGSSTLLHPPKGATPDRTRHGPRGCGKEKRPPGSGSPTTSIKPLSSIPPSLSPPPRTTSTRPGPGRPYLRPVESLSCSRRVLILLILRRPGKAPTLPGFPPEPPGGSERSFRWRCTPLVQCATLFPSTARSLPRSRSRTPSKGDPEPWRRRRHPGS